ncbi:MAG TPA: OmpW family outer membrane protein, partial [Thermoanaerobaculia bacterium]|nr:OmpW family outer membrane protein [Thermoanaerobaculia bacterium]
RRFPAVNFLVFADRASFSNTNSSLDGTVNTGQFGSDIRNETGWGAGVNFYLGRTNLSTEFTYSNIQPRATLTPTNTAFQPITDLRFKMQPITGTLQLHFNPRSSVDFYLGGGGAYVMFKPSSSFNPGNSGLTGLRFRDEWGPLVNAGLGFGFSPNFGINLDAKYMWVRANATPTFGNVTIGNVGNSSRIGVNPFVVSAGLRFGF